MLICLLSVDYKRNNYCENIVAEGIKHSNHHILSLETHPEETILYRSLLYKREESYQIPRLLASSHPH